MVAIPLDICALHAKLPAAIGHPRHLGLVANRDPQVALLRNNVSLFVVVGTVPNLPIDQRRRTLRELAGLAGSELERRDDRAAIVLDMLVNTDDALHHRLKLALVGPGAFP